VRIKNDIDPAGVFIFRQNFRPRFPTVVSAEYSALSVWTKRVTKSRHQHDVLISWIDD
jgi:hypothetical protein